MKRMIALLLCCLLLTACSAQGSTPTTPPTEVSTEAPTEIQLQSFTLYYGDDQAESFLSKEVQVPEISPDVVVQHLISAGALREGVAVNDLGQNGTYLVIDFNQEFADLVCSMGTAGEYIIIGSTVNTFLSAYGAECVMLTVNGGILESGHAIYDSPLTFMS